MKLATALLLVALAAMVSADCYMHNPRGSNNYVDDANNAPANRMFDSQNNNQAGYNNGGASGVVPQIFYIGSELSVLWTVQHGCGDNPKTHCDMILQYRCDPLMRDGTSRDRPEDNDLTPAEHLAAGLPSADRGLHEPYDSWYECERRDRNGGLFIADQNVGNQARSTRQNGGGGRSGYECAEERDYYPYWHPTYWKDMAILTDNTSRCDYYSQESQNVKAKNYCTDISENNEQSCLTAGGSWLAQPAWGLPSPNCQMSPWSRQNHHGLAIPAEEDHAEDLSRYNLTIPNEPSTACLIRIRYNISSDDYDGWNTDAGSNGEQSPIEQDPDYDIGLTTPLGLNINTAQFGRTFEDRSHVTEFQLPPVQVNGKLYNMQVRGKRGNNQQVYPNKEYDFVPSRLVLEVGDWIHIQWTGSENNPQGNDRNNLMQIGDANVNYPLLVSQNTMFNADLTHIQPLARSGNSNDANLQDVTPQYDHGVVQFNQEGEFHFMSSKNNAFTNRSEKGVVVVGDESVSSIAIIIGASVGGVVVIGALGLGVFFFLRMRGSAGSTARF